MNLNEMISFSNGDFIIIKNDFYLEIIIFAQNQQKNEIFYMNPFKFGIFKRNK